MPEQTGPRQYRRIGPHPAGAGQSVLVVETPRENGGTYFLRTYISADSPQATVDVAFTQAETDLEERINNREATHHHEQL